MALPIEIPRNLDLAKICEEEIDYSLDYIQTFTWSVRPKQLRIWGGDSYESQWKCMVLQLQIIKRCCDKYVILPEISDDGRLHCHGWFNVSDKIKYFKQFLPTMRRYGFIDVRKMKSPNWFSYITKNLVTTVQVITGFDDLVLTRYNLEDVVKNIYMIDREKHIAKNTLKLMDVTKYFL